MSTRARGWGEEIHRQLAQQQKNCSKCYNKENAGINLHTHKQIGLSDQKKVNYRKEKAGVHNSKYAQMWLWAGATRSIFSFFSHTNQSVFQNLLRVQAASPRRGHLPFKSSINILWLKLHLPGLHSGKPSAVKKKTNETFWQMFMLFPSLNYAPGP